MHQNACVNKKFVVILSTFLTGVIGEKSGKNGDFTAKIV